MQAKQKPTFRRKEKNAYIRKINPHADETNLHTQGGKNTHPHTKIHSPVDEKKKRPHTKKIPTCRRNKYAYADEKNTHLQQKNNTPAYEKKKHYNRKKKYTHLQTEKKKTYADEKI